MRLPRTLRRQRVRHLVGLAALLAVSVTQAGCGPTFGGRGDSSGAGAGQAGAAMAGCQHPGPLTSAVLPTFDAPDVVTATNPCLSDLAGEVSGLIPDSDRDGLGKFVTGVNTFVSRLSQISDALECGYRTDALAIGIYHNREPLWSVGLAVVLRGGLDSIAASAACYVIDQIPILGLFEGVNPSPTFTKTFCFNVNRENRGGQDYTTMWLGSSNVMCDSLQSKLLPGNGVEVEVRADPNVAVRSAPRLNASVIARAPNGSLGRVNCYVEGDPVTGRLGPTNRWGRTTILGVTGYVSLSYLFAGDPSGVPGVSDLAPVNACT